MSSGAILSQHLLYCGLVGLAVTGLIVWITEYYTGTQYRPVKSVAKASETGHATNVIQGLAVSMEADGSARHRYRRRHPGRLLLGRALRHRRRRNHDASGWRAWSSRWTPTDRSPTTPAASPRCRSYLRRSASIPDALDAVGNTTKAVTKGYAIGSAGLAALVLFAAYTEEIKVRLPEVCAKVGFALQDPYVVIGLFSAACFPTCSVRSA